MRWPPPAAGSRPFALAIMTRRRTRTRISSKDCCYSCLGTRARETGCLSHHFFDPLSHLRRRLDDVDAGSLEGGHLLRRGAFASADDGAGVTHAPPRRGGLSGDEGHNRFGYVLLHEGRRIFLRRSADL